MRSGAACDLKRIPPSKRRPEVAGKHGDAGRDALHLYNTRDSESLVRAKAFDGAAQNRSAGDYGCQQPRQPDVDPEGSDASDLVMPVDSQGTCSDNLELRRILQPHLHGRRETRGRSGELAI